MPKEVRIGGVPLLQWMVLCSSDTDRNTIEGQKVLCWPPWTVIWWIIIIIINCQRQRNHNDDAKGRVNWNNE